ncbi:MAG: GNAT family N-acetyltransferase [Chloroflexota bacterium]|nr:GNAT family N-acetyltransferase [Chloroflexota bacterium]
MNPSLNQSNIELSNFTNADIDSLHKLLHDAGSHGHREWPDTTSDLISVLEFPRVQPHKNLVLAHLENKIVGYAIVEPEKNIGRSIVGFTSTSADPATLVKLLKWGTNRARQETPIAHIATLDHESHVETIIKEHNWKHVRKYLRLDSTPRFSEFKSTINPGFVLRTMMGLHEIPDLTHLQNESFNNHFGYSPNTEGEIKARLLSPGHGIDNVLMIHNAQGQLVAYCWTSLFDKSQLKIGRINMTGVSSNARNQGLGHAIAEAGVNHLIDLKVDRVELEVDSLNTPAMKVYSSLGFKPRNEVNWWEKSI